MALSAPITRNRDALIAIVAALSAMVGLLAGGVVARIDAAVRIQVLRILRPAEAAVRRLIYVAADGVVIKPATPRPATFFHGLRGTSPQTTQQRRAAFQLSDPMVPMIAPVIYDVNTRIRVVMPTDPTFPALWAARVKKLPVERNQIQTDALVRRLQAISAALADIPKQAQRLARWTARRERIANKRPVYTSPLRVGPPPGYRKEPVHEIDRILAECDIRAFDVRRSRQSPDSS